MKKQKNSYIKPCVVLKGEKKPKIGTMDLILLLVGAFLLIFTVAVMVVFVACGSIPDTLVTCVFSVCGGECGVMAWIKTAKMKQAKEKEKQKSEDESNELEEEIVE